MPGATPESEPSNRTHRRAAVMAALRQWIASGRLSPGVRLPPFAELRRQLGAGQTTVRQALAQLQEQGFLETRVEPGVFVAATLPYECNLGVTFEGHPGEARWSTFYQAIEHHVDRLAPKAGYKVIKFYREQGDLNQPGTRALRRMVEEHQLAALLLTAPSLIRVSEWLRLAQLPVVSIASQSGANEPAVCVGGWPWYEAAFARLHASGHRRVGVLVNKFHDEIAMATEICLRAAKQGLMVQPHWVQSVSDQQGTWGANVVELLFRLAPAQRPNALLITDDHLVTAATQGLVAAGVAVPTEVVVVGLCHVGFAPVAHVPVQYVATDIKTLVATCLERLAQRRRGEADIPPITWIPPRLVKIK